MQWKQETSTMNPTVIEILRNANHIAQLVSTFAVWSVVKWLYKRREKSFEKTVLDTFPPENWMGQTVSGVIAKLKRRLMEKEVAGLFAPALIEWRSLGPWLRGLPYRMRYLIKRSLIPSRKRVRKALEALREQGALIREAGEPKDLTLYRGKI
jgi:hypothetical protein